MEKIPTIDRLIIATINTGWLSLWPPVSWQEKTMIDIPVALQLHTMREQLAEDAVETVPITMMAIVFVYRKLDGTDI